MIRNFKKPVYTHTGPGTYDYTHTDWEHIKLVSLRKERLNRQGYDRLGRYYGGDGHTSIYVCEFDTGEYFSVRATSRLEAQAACLDKAKRMFSFVPA